jgi:hypothetical protein
MPCKSSRVTQEIYHTTEKHEIFKTRTPKWNHFLSSTVKKRLISIGNYSKETNIKIIKDV